MRDRNFDDIAEKFSRNIYGTTKGQLRQTILWQDLDKLLADLTAKGYLKLEHPKKKVGKTRVPDTMLPKGYNIVAGKMSFEISKVLNPQDIAPTLFVVDGEGLRTLTLREGLRLFGYPDTYQFNVSLEDGYDLLGNTVVVPVIQQVAGRLLDVYNEV